MYDLLVDAARVTPVPGNQEGSYLTMKSNQGLVFGAATILSGFAGVFCDQGVWFFLGRVGILARMFGTALMLLEPGYWQRVRVVVVALGDSLLTLLTCLWLGDCQCTWINYKSLCMFVCYCSLFCFWFMFGFKYWCHLNWCCGRCSVVSPGSQFHGRSQAVLAWRHVHYLPTYVVHSITYCRSVTSLLSPWCPAIISHISRTALRISSMYYEFFIHKQIDFNVGLLMILFRRPVPVWLRLLLLLSWWAREVLWQSSS